jgi:hypothetical protein
MEGRAALQQFLMRQRPDPTQCQVLIAKCTKEKKTQPERARPESVSFPMRFLRSTGGAGVSTGTLGRFSWALCDSCAICSQKFCRRERRESPQSTEKTLPRLQRQGMPLGGGGRKLSNNYRTFWADRTARAGPGSRGGGPSFRRGYPSHEASVICGGRSRQRLLRSAGTWL